ncbi:MAG TPA: protease inhibitor I42 family protein [Anaerolineales bacterium]|nr:protease inhibitor I42 family protein [Anaerolineales bacterium]
MKKVFVLPILAILLASCGSPTPTPVTQTRPAITEPSAPIEAQAGEAFHIVIDANPSTGYHWELIGELDGNVVEFVSRDYTADEPVMPGSGGVDVWIFKAVSAGEVQITLGSYPPGVTEGEPEQSVTFNVIVR